MHIFECEFGCNCYRKSRRQFLFVYLLKSLKNLFIIIIRLLDIPKQKTAKLSNINTKFMRDWVYVYVTSDLYRE